MFPGPVARAAKEGGERKCGQPMANPPNLHYGTTSNGVIDTEKPWNSNPACVVFHKDNLEGIYKQCMNEELLENLSIDSQLLFHSDSKRSIWKSGLVVERDRMTNDQLKTFFRATNDGCFSGLQLKNYTSGANNRTISVHGCICRKDKCNVNSAPERTVGLAIVLSALALAGLLSSGQQAMATQMHGWKKLNTEFVCGSLSRYLRVDVGIGFTVGDGLKLVMIRIRFILH